MYHRAYTTIIDDAAAIFLYEPKLVAEIRLKTPAYPALGGQLTLSARPGRWCPSVRGDAQQNLRELGKAVESKGEQEVCCTDG